MTTNDVPAQRIYKPEGYTDCDQRSDTSFLVGVNYGRESERERIAQAIDDHALRCRRAGRNLYRRTSSPGSTMPLVSPVLGPLEAPMPELNEFDVIAAKAWQIVDFHCITHEITLTDDERDAVQLGLASGVHAAIEHYHGAGPAAGGDGR